MAGADSVQTVAKTRPAAITANRLAGVTIQRIKSSMAAPYILKLIMLRMTRMPVSIHTPPPSSRKCPMGVVRSGVM